MIANPERGHMSTIVNVDNLHEESIVEAKTDEA